VMDASIHPVCRAAELAWGGALRIESAPQVKKRAHKVIKGILNKRSYHRFYVDMPAFSDFDDLAHWSQYDNEPVA